METKHKNLLKRYALGQYLCFTSIQDLTFFDAITECESEDEFYRILDKHDVEVWEPLESMYFGELQGQITSTYQLLKDVYDLAKE